MTRIILIFLFCLTSVSAQAACTGSDLMTRLTPAAEARLARDIQSVPFAYGNHWIARKGERIIHIVGTQHNADRRMAPVMRTLRPIIRKVDAVLLEQNAAEQSKLRPVLRDNPSLMFMPSGPRLHQRMSEDAWRHLSEDMQRQEIAPDRLTELQPWFISLLYFGSSCGKRGFGNRRGLDDRIEAYAQRHNIPVGSLERAGDGVRQLARQPIGDQIRLLELNLDSQDDYDDQAVTLTNAYFRESLAEAMLIREWTLFSDQDIPRSEVRKLLRQIDTGLLDRRNHAWMPVILRHPARTLFVAVGAAHLPGSAGVLNLLHKQGFALERAAF